MAGGYRGEGGMRGMVMDYKGDCLPLLTLAHVIHE